MFVSHVFKGYTKYTKINSGLINVGYRLCSVVAEMATVPQC